MSISAMQQSVISDLIQNQRKFFQSGRTRDIDFRVKQLRTLRTAIIENEAAILEACKSDMIKPPMEAYTSERGMVLNEIDQKVFSAPLPRLSCNDRFNFFLNTLRVS